MTARRYLASVTYHERPGDTVPLYSLHDDGLYTESGAKARITRELQESWRRGLTVKESSVRYVTDIDGK